MEQNNFTHKQERRIRLSLHSKDYDPSHNVNFTVNDVPVSELQGTITRFNYSPIIWLNGYRDSDNFDSVSMFGMDIDGGKPIDEMEDQLKQLDLNYFLTTTKSHKPKDHRYRVGFPYSRIICTHEQHKEAGKAIDKQFGGHCDPKVFDGARFFFGSPEDAYWSSNWTGHDFDVTPFIDRDLSKVRYGDGDWSDSTQLALADGTMKTVSQLTGKTRILCPFHKDQNSSSFVDYSKKSKNWFIHCSACNKTWWKTKIKPPLEERCMHFWSHSKDIFEAGMTSESFYFNEINEKKFNEAVRRAGLPETIHLHSTRHTYASYLLQAATPLAEIQKLLGHQSITTTQIYSHLEEHHLRVAAERLRLPEF